MPAKQRKAQRGERRDPRSASWARKAATVAGLAGRALPPLPYRLLMRRYRSRARADDFGAQPHQRLSLVGETLDLYIEDSDKMVETAPPVQCSKIFVGNQKWSTQ
jgi:hypothetical protein